VKRIALVLSVGALLMVCAVYAPDATAQTEGEVDIQQLTLGPGGSVIVSGTIQCPDAANYNVVVYVFQGNNKVRGREFGWCNTSGQESFTQTVSGEMPFKQGRMADVIWLSEGCNVVRDCWRSRGHTILYID
jgi:hypothetical protein